MSAQIFRLGIDDVVPPIIPPAIQFWDESNDWGPVRCPQCESVWDSEDPELWYSEHLCNNCSSLPE